SLLQHRGRDRCRRRGDRGGRAMSDLEPLPREIGEYYASGVESGRLVSGPSALELLRTQELLQRFLPKPPAILLDVGGGPGRAACWLAGLGYEVHLVDAVPLHVERAQAAAADARVTLASARAGDARELESADGFADAVLLMGPLYHLTERADRLTALAEAR